MGKRKLSKAARFERMFRVWDYLKNNTDKEHPTTQAEMRKSSEVAGFLGDKETFNRLIKDMARTMNSDKHGYKPEKDWKIYFHDFKKYYGMMRKILMRKRILAVKKRMTNLPTRRCILTVYITTGLFLMMK